MIHAILLGIGVYVALGVAANVAAWWCGALDDPKHPHDAIPFGMIAIQIVLWPICVIHTVAGWIKDLEIPSRAQWEERRRDEAERRALPSEVTPVGEHRCAGRRVR